MIITMLLEAVGAVMIALGIMGIFLSFNSGKGDKEIRIVLLACILFIIAGGWLIISSIGFYVLLKKAVGIAILLAGAFLVFKFPGSYAQEGFYTTIAVLIGLILLIFGLYLAMF